MEFKLNAEYKKQLKHNKAITWLTKHTSARTCEKVFDWKNWLITIGMPLMLFGPLIYRAIEKYLVTYDMMAVSIPMSVVKLILGATLYVTFPFLALMFFFIFKLTYFNFVTRCVYDVVYAVCYPYYLIKQNSGA